MMHPELVAGAWVGYNDNSVTMGSWGQGARSALPIVGDVFQQALRQRWIDPKVEFDIPRPRPRLPEGAREQQADPVQRFFDGVRRFFRGL